jgi:broad specificity phosphatase PhoE
VRLFLVRHGESVGNSENRLQGQTDYDLSDLGRRQAELTAQRLCALGTTALYTSPLLRALQTAKTIGERMGREPQLLPGVAEYDFGELAGLTYAELRARFALRGVQSPTERVYPGEEGREHFLQRVTEAFAGVIESHPGETVAVVSHGGPIALYCQRVLGMPYRRPMPFVIANCSLNLIAVSDELDEAGERPMLLDRLNDTCHLRE